MSLAAVDENASVLSEVTPQKQQRTPARHKARGPRVQATPQSRSAAPPQESVQDEVAEQLLSRIEVLERQRRDATAALKAALAEVATQRERTTEAEELCAKLADKAKQGAVLRRTHERHSRAWMAQCAALAAERRRERGTHAQGAQQLAQERAAREAAERECHGLRARVQRMVQLKAAQETAARDAAEQTARALAEQSARESAARAEQSARETQLQRQGFYYASIALKLQWALEGRSGGGDVAMLWEQYARDNNAPDCNGGRGPDDCLSWLALHMRDDDDSNSATDPAAQ